MSKVTAEQLIKPQGDLDVALLFPDDDQESVHALLTGWLNKAYKIITAEAVEGEDQQNAAAEAFAYYKAYSDVHTRMSANPIRADVAGEAGQSFEFAQIREFGIKAGEYQDAFNGLLLAAKAVTPIEPSRSRSLPNSYRW